MAILCAFQLSAVSAKNVSVKFNSDAGKLYLYNNSSNIDEISDCRFDLSNRKVICHAEYSRSSKFHCMPDSDEECILTQSMDYNLEIPITKITGSSCTLTNGTTFKSSKLKAQNSNKKWVQAHSLANYKLIMKDDVPYLPETLTPSTPQRFDFITTKGCQFSAHYEKVIAVLNAMREVG